MQSLTINYLSHDRLESEKYWQITSHFLNLIKNKNQIRLNLLLTHDNDFEKYLDPQIKVEKHICKSYIEKIKIASKSNTEFSLKLDEDVFFSNHLFDKFIEISLENSNDGVYWPLLSLNTRLTDVFIEKFVKNEEIKDNIFKEFLKTRFPWGIWNQKYYYLNLNKHSLFSSLWNSKKYFQSLKRVKSKYKGIHPVRISYSVQLLINNYISENLDKIFKKYSYTLTEFENIYITSNAYMMKTEYFKKYLALDSIDMFDEVQLNDFINNENIKSFYIENGYAIHTMFNTVKGEDKHLKNLVSKREASLEELYFVEKIRSYIFDI